MIELLLLLAVLPVLLPAMSLLVLTCAAMLPPRRRAVAIHPEMPAPRVVVLVPAHNESGHVLPTLASLHGQLGAGDRVLVVADNCSDDTAERARQAGADVVERSDALRRGKGFALAFGVDRLRADPPDVVLVVDADCVLGAGAVDAIARACHGSGRPVQMLNLMDPPPQAGLRQRVLAFAMAMKNRVRPLGSDRLGGACALMGTGMALPWALASTADLATNHLAEDMKLGVALSLAGHAPKFLPHARVSSQFVADDEAARRQKKRWEHGHLDTLREELPALLRAAALRRSPALVVLALDLMIPPLALYLMVLVSLCLILAAGAWLWPALALALAAACSLAALGAFGLAIVLAWWQVGRPLLRASELLRLPLYAAWKLPIYLSYAFGARSGWVRTLRDGSARAGLKTGSRQP